MKCGSTAPVVLDANSLEEQFEMGGVKELWSKAVGDVVMRMFKAQADEQRMSRDDPLAMLNLDSHPMNLPLIGTEKKVNKEKERLDLEQAKQNMSVGERIGRRIYGITNLHKHLMNL